MEIQLTKKQAEYIREAHHRWNMSIGAVRSGKSFLAIQYVIPSELLACKGKKGLNVILGATQGNLTRNIIHPMQEIWGKNLVSDINSDNIAVIFGEKVFCIGCETKRAANRLRGSEIKFCYVDEITDISQDSFEMLKSRLSLPYSICHAAANPQYPSHFIKKFLDSANNGVDIYEQDYTLYDNPFLPTEFIHGLEAEYEGTAYYQRYILGKWTKAEGLIYPNYQDAYGVFPGDAMKDYKDICFSIDYGTMNATACILWLKASNGVWYAHKGYYYSGRNTGRQKTDEEYADEIIAYFSDYLQKESEKDDDEIAYYSDLKNTRADGSFKKISTIIDPSAASFITLMKKKGYFKVIKADNNVLDGIRETATAMYLGKIKINPAIKDWTKEVEGYVWDEAESEDRPVKVDDHCLIGETLVNTKDGAKPISELVETSGEVWSYNTKTGVAELKPYHNCRLTQRQAEIYEIETKDGRFIRCTGEHPILTERGYVLTKDLTVSDRIIDIMEKQRPVAEVAETSSVGIKAIRKIGKADVYNMEVEDNHNFAIEDGLIVHNCMDAMRYFVKTKHIVKPNRSSIK